MPGRHQGLAYPRASGRHDRARLSYQQAEAIFKKHSGGRVRAATGIQFRPVRPSASRFLGMMTSRTDADYWQAHLAVAARTAARNLDLAMTVTAEDIFPATYLMPRP